MDSKNNTGKDNSGDRNSGDRNSGDRNSGYCNSGYRNSGDRNSGNGNSGNENSGYGNSGNGNSGNENSGYGNKANRSSGIFCTEEPRILSFNKPTENSWDEIEHPSFEDFYLNKWVAESDMTDDEKKEQTDFRVRGGYLKTYTWEDAWANYWRDSDEDERQRVLNLPNFDAEIFKEITGIDIAADEWEEEQKKTCYVCGVPIDNLAASIANPDGHRHSGCKAKPDTMPESVLTGADLPQIYRVLEKKLQDHTADHLTLKMWEAIEALIEKKLELLNLSGSWQGDDFEKCLDEVSSSRSKEKDAPVSQHDLRVMWQNLVRLIDKKLEERG